MNKSTFSFRSIPGWAYTVALVGVLYLTGLHTEVIGQVQRLLLATGLKEAEVSAPVTAVSSDSESAASTSFKRAGTGFEMVRLDGTPVNFESLHGKVIFLNVWATWCPPCVAEMPNIQSLYEKVGSEKIAFVMLSVDEGGLAKVQKYIQKKGYTFPVYLLASAMPQEFESASIPTTFIISPAGKIMHTQVGLAQYDTEEVRNYLLNLAK
ncbi:TlpA family protein disulfide reductase [Rufibacter immobilis]|uniref:TlpA family protein disulfide reductase n=1 Tax=Rufibacter immobilis TaxID=1348778 RepID=A0A3M9MRL6_9BACT|nr:TlpA disulfide reductase family protein [Rufibacter immobilis]RNI28129.1 TlpA family protein disulfide reductase [Rufibacter immobilis]